MKAESAIMLQGRVLFALVIREMATRFGKTAGGYIWAVVEPAATVAMLTAIFAQISRTPALGDSFPLYFATAYMAFHIYRDVSGGVSNAILANMALLNFPRITILDTILARFILQFLTGVFVTTLVIGGVYIVEGATTGVDFAPVFIAIGLAALFGLSVGAVNAILFPYSPTWARLFNLVNRPLFLISGVFFIYEDLPRWIQDVLWWNPILHVTARMREGFYPMYEARFASDIYVVAVALCLLFLGILLMRRLQGAVLEQ